METVEQERKAKNAKKKKFRLTQPLIRIAIREGLTQTEIARMCRTHQSVVSSWNSGEKQAYEHQLTLLLEQFGHKLRRNAFKVYWSLDANTSKTAFYRVEGRVILSQSFSDPRRQGHKLVKRIPVHKLVIHDQGRGKFRTVEQCRLRNRRSNEELECSHEDAIWTSKIGDQIGVEELLSFIDAYCKTTLEGFPSDAMTLPYLIRKALLNHGHHVDGVADFPAVW